MGKIETCYLTIRVDFEADCDYNDFSNLEMKEAVGEIVVERVNAHNHTIESGIRIDGVEIC